MSVKINRFIVFDTETTGISIEDGHKIIEIGCVEVVDGKMTGTNFHSYLNPEREIDKEALEVHNISAAFLKDKPKFVDIASGFQSFLHKDDDVYNTYLVAHNANFDVRFINYEFSLIGVDENLYDNFEIIDTVILSRKIYPGQPANLNALCERLGIDKSERDANGHGALLDAKLLAHAFLLLTAERDVLSLIEKQVDFVGFFKNENAVQSRDFSSLITEEELNNHSSFTKKYALKEW
ncbi:MAG: hypothetical protein RL208_709 [Pseudomonadota bacterium]|jgi:DNA polymerase-3 subunit epsilon